MPSPGRDQPNRPAKPEQCEKSPHRPVEINQSAAHETICETTPAMAKALEKKLRSPETAALSFEEHLGLIVHRERTERHPASSPTGCGFPAAPPLASRTSRPPRSGLDRDLLSLAVRALGPRPSQCRRSGPAVLVHSAHLARLMQEFFGADPPNRPLSAHPSLRAVPAQGRRLRLPKALPCTPVDGMTPRRISRRTVILLIPGAPPPPEAASSPALLASEPPRAPVRGAVTDALQPRVTLDRSSARAEKFAIDRSRISSQLRDQSAGLGVGRPAVMAGAVLAP